MDGVLPSSFLLLTLAVTMQRKPSIRRMVSSLFVLSKSHFCTIIFRCMRQEGARKRYLTCPSRARHVTGRIKMAANAERTDFAAAQHAPEEVSRRKVKDDERGGHNCEFVEPPPASFQTECPICLLILKEPCAISCPCGQKMCSECVERIKKEGKRCPLCNKTDFSFIRDYGLERYMKEFEVRCSHVKDSCEWRGKLGEFEQHLNRNPSPENRPQKTSWTDASLWVLNASTYVGGGTGVAMFPFIKWNTA